MRSTFVPPPTLRASFSSSSSLVDFRLRPTLPSSYSEVAPVAETAAPVAVRTFFPPRFLSSLSKSKLVADLFPPSLLVCVLTITGGEGCLPQAQPTIEHPNHRSLQGSFPLLTLSNEVAFSRRRARSDVPPSSRPSLF